VTIRTGLTGSGKLTTDAYAIPQEVKMGGTSCTWIAAVHPATPAVWQSRHAVWLANGGFGNGLR
jgi:hypothetical protein